MGGPPPDYDPYAFVGQRYWEGGRWSEFRPSPTTLPENRRAAPKQSTRRYLVSGIVMLVLGIVSAGVSLVLLAHAQSFGHALTDSIDDWMGSLEGDTAENWILAMVGIAALFFAGLARPALFVLIVLGSAAAAYLIGHGTFRAVRWLTARRSSRPPRAEA